MGAPSAVKTIVTGEAIGNTISALTGRFLKNYASESVAGVAGVIASTISGMMSILDAEAKSDEYQAASQGLNVINSLLDIFNNHPEYVVIQVQLSVFEWYNPEVGATMVIVDGTAAKPSDAYIIQRIQLNNGTWLEQQ